MNPRRRFVAILLIGAMPALLAGACRKKTPAPEHHPPGFERRPYTPIPPPPSPTLRPGQPTPLPRLPE